MRRNALQLASQHANGLCALRYFQFEQFLHCHHISEVVAEWIQIIHTVGDDYALLILLVFKKLFHPRMEIADVWRRLDYHLAVKHQLETQHTVSRRMLWAHRNRHLRVERTIDDLKLRRNVYGGTHKFSER